LIYAIWSCEALGSLQINIASLPTKLACVRYWVKVVESLISSGIEDHTFEPINLSEHFREEELTLGKNRFLEVARLVE